MQLPAEAVREETLPVRITVFNYEDSAARATVTVEISDGAELLEGDYVSVLEVAPSAGATVSRTTRGAAFRGRVVDREPVRKWTSALHGYLLVW